jgi:steroid delta-isomerase-like uncharacterized protein
MSNSTVDTVTALLGAIDRNDWAAVSNSITDDFTMEMPGQAPIGKDAFIGFCQGWFASFPDLVHDIQESLGEGDRAAMRFIVRGTHKGDFMGLPPSGRTIATSSAGMATVRDGKVSRLWAQPDFMAMMQQLGAIPEPATV